METALQKITKYISEHRFNIESQSGDHYIVVDYKELESLFEDSLNEEKEQIREAYREGVSHGSDATSSFDWGHRIKEVTSEDYFNETYKKNNDMNNLSSEDLEKMSKAKLTDNLFTKPSFHHETIECPFCHEKDFDKIGLKNHLLDDCRVYDGTGRITRL